MSETRMVKVGRNEPCPCGSGKKYKNCCISASRATDNRNPVSESALAHISRARDCAARGALDEAIAAFRAALSIAPALAEVHNDLGLAHQAKGQLDEAVRSYRAALSINPGLAAAHFNLGRALQVQGRHEAAVESYRRFLVLDPGYFQAHHNLGVAFEALGQTTEAVAAYRRAFELKATYFPSLFGTIRTLTKLVPLWHVPMMNDAERNEAYFASLRSAVTPRSRVFEIGTGSGLLAMMAAQLGAAQVTTCEAETIVADTARQVIAANGFDQKITVLTKKSTDVIVGSDLPQPAEILVQEIFASNLLSENVLASIEDAKRRLLTPDCRMIPAAASIMIALIGGEEMRSNLLVEDVHGFDLRRFNAIVPRVRTVQRKDLDIEFLSDEVEAFKFDFQRDSAWHPEEKILRLRVKQDGRCLGILQWIRLYFGEDAIFENHPRVRTAATGWPACAYLNVLPVGVTRGETVAVFATHDKTQPWFELRDVV
jgi:predicted RNA methylase/Flp pilus assembly protein TadD